MSNTSISFKPETKQTKSRTKQNFKDECNINILLKKYKKQGVSIPVGIDPNATFGDFSDIGDFQEHFVRMENAQKMFMTLPAETRYKFKNDVSNLLQFISDDANIEQSYELGILPKPKPEQKPFDENVQPKAEPPATAGS